MGSAAQRLVAPARRGPGSPNLVGPPLAKTVGRPGTPPAGEVHGRVDRANEAVADAFERIADLLEAQAGDSYRVRAYRHGAASVRACERDVAELLAERGRSGLEELPHVGRSLAALIEEMLSTGRVGLLQRLEGQVAPEDLFATVPGLGDELASRIASQLHIDTLEELELAAHDGRLAALPGFGRRRVAAVREALASMLGRSNRRRARLVRSHLLMSGAAQSKEEQAAEERATEEHAADEPSVAVLLRVDRLYRTRARQGRLPRIAPRRFNPSGRAWLPIMHHHEDGWHFTAMYSNTARAHRLRRTDDWVVLYFERDGHESQCTVVTEYHGPDGGRRVIRGRERQCHAYYEALPPERHFAVPAF